MTRRLASAALCFCAVACRPAIQSHPQPLLSLVAEGRPAHVEEIGAGPGKRRALAESARYRLFVPRHAAVVFSLGAMSLEGAAPARGFLSVELRSEGRLLGERRLNPRTATGLRPTSLSFEGPGRNGSLELVLGLVSGRGEPLPLPAGLHPSVVEPILLDRDAFATHRGIVLVSIDTLRRDHVSLYGYPRPTTPHIDALAEAGLAFDDAVSVSSWTLPAHFSMMTGVEPAAHGATHSRRAYNHRVPTVATLLRAGGFRTHAITSAAYVSPRYGLDDGFDEMDCVHNRRASQVADAALAFLDGIGDRPFFLFLHFYDPHWRYDPPGEQLELFLGPGWAAPAGAEWAKEHPAAEKLKPGDLAHIEAFYDGEIRYADEQLSRVLERLRTLGLETRTLVLVTSDHGEEFLDHGGWSHGKTLHEELIRIPLVLRGPGVPRGQRTSKQVSTLDLAPTMLDWAGLPPRAEHHGRSLLRALAEREAYGETNGPADTQLLFLRGGRGKWKMVYTLEPETGAVKGEDWYDLGVDPRETRNAPPGAELAGAIRTRLLGRWRAARRGGPGPRVELSAQELEQLRGVGYLP